MLAGVEGNCCWNGVCESNVKPLERPMWGRKGTKSVTKAEAAGAAKLDAKSPLGNAMPKPRERPTLTWQRGPPLDQEGQTQGDVNATPGRASRQQSPLAAGAAEADIETLHAFRKRKPRERPN